MISSIFFKDLKLHCRNLLIFPLAVLAGLLAIYFGDQATTVTLEGFLLRLLSFVFALCVLISLLVGMSVIATEKTEGTDLLLRRLPRSYPQVLLEKLLAGGSFLLALYLVTVLYYTLVLTLFDSPVAREQAAALGSFRFNLAVFMLSGFGISVALSHFISNSLAILLGTIAVFIVGWALMELLRPDSRIDSELIGVTGVYMFLLCVMPGLFVWKRWVWSIPESAWGVPGSRTLLKGLVIKQMAQDGIYYLFALLLLIAAMLYRLLGPGLEESASRSDMFDLRNSVPVLLLMGLAAFLVVQAGASAYTNNEGRGAACIAYAHPLSRSGLYLSKILAALPLIFVSWIVLSVINVYSLPLVSLLIFLLFLYATALHESLWLKSQIMVIPNTLGWALFLYICIVDWLTPDQVLLFFSGFASAANPYLLGLIPLTLITLGTLLTGWKMACDRNFLVATDNGRLRYNAVMTGAVLLPTLILTWLAQLFV